MRSLTKIASFVVILLTGATGPVIAQNCEPGTASAELNVNNVGARLFNAGNLFFNGNGAGYEIPQGSGRNSVFAASLWMGGKVDSEVRTITSRYGPWLFYPGPRGADGNLPANCDTYDHIWTVSRSDLAAYVDSNIVTDNVRSWPVELGAPTLDCNGNPNDYKPHEGDRPALLGDQTAWWIMNDGGSERPLNVTVRATAFAVKGWVPALDNATFYRYHITYNGDRRLDSTYVGLFVDTDLGNALDDYVGSDTSHRMGFVYNGDSVDEGHHGYGEAPPALGVVALSPDLPAFHFFELRDPRNLHRFVYHILRGRWRDGSPITEGGRGRQTGKPICCMYPGNPGAFWSEGNVWPDAGAEANSPFDRRMVVSTGPFTLRPGASETVAFAFIWARGDSRLESVNNLKGIASGIHSIYPSLIEEARTGCRYYKPPVPDRLIAYRNKPNPFSSSTSFSVDLPAPARVQLTVYDVLGREALSLPFRQFDAGYGQEIRLETTAWPAGVYFYRYKITYRGEFPLEDAYVGMFADPDLGHALDDYIGSDLSMNMGYAYNGDGFDDGSYGEYPPAVGVISFAGMTHFMMHYGGSSVLSFDPMVAITVPSLAFQRRYSDHGRRRHFNSLVISQLFNFRCI